MIDFLDTLKNTEGVQSIEFKGNGTSPKKFIQVRVSKAKSNRETVYSVLDLLHSQDHYEWNCLFTL